MRRFYLKILAAVFFSTAVAVAQPAGQTELDGLIKEALANNPELKAMREQAEAFKQRVPQAKSLDSPQMTIEFSQASLAYFPDPIRDQKEIDYGLLQMIPYPGKLYASGNSARRAAEMAEQDLRAKELEVIAELKKAYYELYFVQREKAINFETQKLMTQFVAITRRQYEVGKANQSDVLKAEVSLAELIKAALNLEKDKVEKEAALQRILGRSETREFGWIKDIESDLPDYNFGQMMPVVRENNPELKAQTLNTEMNRAELSLAKNSFGPDLMAKGTYKAMQGYSDDVWDLMLGVSVPVAPWSYQKYSSRLKESRFSLNQSENEYAAKENALAADLKNILAQIQATGQLKDLYNKDWIPRLVQTMESVLAAYQTGKVDVLMVLDTYRTLLMARNDYEMTVRDYMSAQADLEKITGQSVAQLKDKIK